MNNKMLTQNGWFSVEVKENIGRNDGSIKVVVKDPSVDACEVVCNAVELDNDGLQDLEQAISPHCINDQYNSKVSVVAMKIQEALNIYKMLSGISRRDKSVLVDIELIRQFNI